MKRLLALAIILSPTAGFAEVPFDRGFGICFDTPSTASDFTYETFKEAGAPKPSKKLARYMKNKECVIVVSTEADEEVSIDTTYLVMCKEKCGWRQAGRYVVISDWPDGKGDK